MRIRFGYVRPVLMAGMIGLLVTNLYAVQSVASQAAPGFRMSARGQALQLRNHVPVSGVVLYEPTGTQSWGNALEEAGPNVRCNQDPIGNSQNEITVAASPVNTNNLLTGSNDYRNGDASGGFYRSTDGAGTFSDALVSRGPAGVFEAAGDPVACVDNNGRMYATYIAFDRTTQDNGLYVQTSTNNGSTWSTPAPVLAHTSGGNEDFEDKPYACCDYSPGSAFLNNYYVTWTHFALSGATPIYFAKSTNGGASFSAPVQISSSTNTQFSNPTVGPNGEIFVVWFDYSTGNIKFDKSTNGGTSWGADITVSSFNDNFPANPCGSFRQISYPVIVCDISGSSRHGWLYVSWIDCRLGNPHVYFSKSTNSGSTWSAAQRIDNDGTNRWQWFHWMSCNPATGDLGAAWLDRREDASDCSYKEYATLSSDGGVTWAPNFPVATVASNPSSSNFLGDYGGASFRSDGFYAGWTDLRNDGGDCFAAWFRPNAPSITVLVPNGGESWFVGDNNNITWTSSNLNENVHIEINRTYPGASWSDIVASTPNTGSFTWPVSSPTTTTARVRISGTVTTAVKDTSNANFTIGQRTITVLSPNGGENLVIGNSTNLTWSSQNLTGTVNVQLNRTYPGATWETLFAGTTNDGIEPWTITTPATTTARLRVVSVSFPAVGDTSNANFTISAPNMPPVLTHDPLDDFAPGTGVITAIASDAQLFASIVSVKMFYRLAGASPFDSIALASTGNLNEYSASLASLPIGSYEYYVRALDNGGLTALQPDSAPAVLYTFDVNTFCGAEMTFDDGSAEHYNFTPDPAIAPVKWAVKFGPVQTPYVLCAARFAAARTLPTTQHSQVYYAVYLADGPGGLPGTLVRDGLTGSIGNVVGGLPAGTNWADVIIRDNLNGPLVINSSQFYVAVANLFTGKVEAFGRDTTGVNNHRSYVYDPCMTQWFSEDDVDSTVTHPGNRLIRARGYSLVPPVVVARRSGNDIRLDWTSTSAPAYRVYSATTPGGPFGTLEGVTPDTTFFDVGAVTAGAILFYEVKSASQ